MGFGAGCGGCSAWLVGIVERAILCDREDCKNCVSRISGLYTDQKLVLERPSRLFKYISAKCERRRAPRTAAAWKQDPPS